MTRGQFIVFEGPNGCGKGEQITRFQHKLRGMGKAVPVFITGEPNETFDGIWGAKAREMLKGDGDPYQNQLDALNFFSKNRYVHNQVFRPLLEKGSHVVSDRYYNSTFAFQHAQGVPYENIANANRSEEILVPDLTFILDVPVDVSLERLAKRDGKNKRKFEGNLDFMESVRSNYLEQPVILSRFMGDNGAVIVDGSKSIDFVAQDIWSIYTDCFLK